MFTLSESFLKLIYYIFYDHSFARNAIMKMATILGMKADTNLW
jgi:hypothetical protein